MHYSVFILHLSRPAAHDSHTVRPVPTFDARVEDGCIIKTPPLQRPSSSLPSERFLPPSGCQKTDLSPYLEPRVWRACWASLRPHTRRTTLSFTISRVQWQMCSDSRTWDHISIPSCTLSYYSTLRTSCSFPALARCSSIESTGPWMRRLGTSGTQSPPNPSPALVLHSPEFRNWWGR